MVDWVRFRRNAEILQMTTGALSVIASSLLICTILRSKKKLSVPYRRLMFGICVFDIFLSGGFATGSLMSPKGIRPWALGNVTTCEIQGFFYMAGMLGTPLYLCSLCVYYFCIIVINIRHNTFHKFIEPLLHAAPIIYSFSFASYALSKQYMNNLGPTCYANSWPPFCDYNPEIECTRGPGAYMWGQRLAQITHWSSFCIVFISMAVIVYSAKRVERRNRRYSFPTGSVRSADSSNPLRKIGARISASFKKDTQSSSSNNINNNNNSTSMMSSSISNVAGGDDNLVPVSPTTAETNQSKRQRRRRSSNAVTTAASRQRTREIYKQALLYVGCFLLSYGSTWLAYAFHMARNTQTRFWLIMHALFFPTQGLFNVFVYCRPHIVALQTKYPNEYTWFRAFRVVLRSGGDICQATVAAERREHRQQRQDRRGKTDKTRLLMDDDVDIDTPLFDDVDSEETPSEETPNKESPSGESDKEVDAEETPNEKTPNEESPSGEEKPSGDAAPN